MSPPSMLLVACLTGSCAAAGVTLPMLNHAATPLGRTYARALVMMTGSEGADDVPLTPVEDRGVATSAAGDGTSARNGARLYDPLAQVEAAATSGASDVAQIHAEADATFAALDANGDGAISLQELQAHLGAIGYSDAAAGRLFALLDDNADGELSRDELRAAFVRLSEDPAALRAQLDLARVHAEADELFAALDRNGDGEVSAGELRAHVAAAGYAPAAAERFFAVLDANNDGAVSRDELREAFARYADPALRLALGLGATDADAIFSAVDADGDGAIVLPAASPESNRIVTRCARPDAVRTQAYVRGKRPRKYDSVTLASPTFLD